MEGNHLSVVSTVVKLRSSEINWSPGRKEENKHLNHSNNILPRNWQVDLWINVCGERAEMKPHTRVCMFLCEGVTAGNNIDLRRAVPGCRSDNLQPPGPPPRPRSLCHSRSHYHYSYLAAVPPSASGQHDLTDRKRDTQDKGKQNDRERQENRKGGSKRKTAERCKERKRSRNRVGETERTL